MSTEDEIREKGFTFVDKRGENNPIKEKLAPEPTDVDTREVKDRRWTSEDYILVLNQAADGSPLIIGRAIGFANDENCFYADVLFPPRWLKDYNWQSAAKERLDTFLQCSCDPSGQCPYHRRWTQGGWLKQDTRRIADEGNRPASKALEVYFKAEQARQQAQRILAPRR